MKEDELSLKFQKELASLRQFRDPDLCSISIPLNGTELGNVDIDVLKNKLRSLGLYVSIQKKLDKNGFTIPKSERLFISLTPFEN